VDLASGVATVEVIVHPMINWLWLGGVVLLVVWLARNAGRTALGASAGEAPLDILKARYAKGEITKEQLDAIKRDLGA